MNRLYRPNRATTHHEAVIALHLIMEINIDPRKKGGKDE